MTLIEQLLAKAAANRDEAHKLVDKDYEKTVRRIKALGEKLKVIKPKRFGVREFKAKPPGMPFHRMYGIQCAVAILGEGQPMTMLELVVEMRRRGCRAKDNPRSVIKSLQQSFRYHREKFVQDGEERWSLANPA